MSGRLDGKVALVTGAGRGIGKTLALGLAEAGALVHVNDLDSPDETVAQLPEDRRGLALACDVSDTGAIHEMFARIDRLDVLVNCAGVTGWIDLADPNETTWDTVVDTNLKGTFFMCRYAIPALEATGGCIVNVSSDAGLWGNKGAAIYCASKGGVTVLTKALAVELAARGVRANAVCPGDVDSPMMRYQADTFGAGDPEAYMTGLLAAYPQRPARFIRPAEVAELIRYLTTPEATPITGAAISIDFGLTAGY
jgi:NAD(P)-dependent dehydrogenase (short-subunit alcohol dehydrogenase family)